MSGSLSFQQVPTSSTRTLGSGKGGLWGGGVGEGVFLATDLTWKMTRRATTSRLFIGFPAGDKVRKLLLGRQGQLFVRKESLGEGWGHCWELSSQAPGTAFVWNIRTRLCLEAPGLLPSHARPHLLFLHSDVPERSGIRMQGSPPLPTPCLALQAIFWSWKTHPGPYHPSRLSFD